LGGTVALDLRIRQRELDVIAAVDRQIVDAALADRVGAGAARSFDELGLSADFDDFPASRDDERNGQLGQAADGDGDAGGFGFGEAGRVHGDGINARSQLTHTVAALAVAAAGAFQQGAQQGLADPVTFNNAMRQASVVAAMIAQFTADNGPSNVNDDGNVATLEALETRLSDGRRFLFGERFTESDIRAFTLALFDSIDGSETGKAYTARFAKKAELDAELQGMLEKMIQECAQPFRK